MTDFSADKLRALDEKATPGQWEAKVWRHVGQSDTVCIKADGSEIIGWNGFDGVPCTKAQIRANAKLLAYLRNAVPAILAMEEREKRMREALDWALNEIRSTTRYDNEQQFWNCYDLAQKALGEEKA